MTCSPWQFAEALDQDEEADLELLRQLLKKCAAKGFSSEAFRAFIRRGARFAMYKAWEYYRDSAVAPTNAYVQAVLFFWNLGNWHGMPCRVLAELATYVAKAAAKYEWPAKWPFLAMAAVAAEKRGCGIPDVWAEALGPDDYRMLVAFLEKGEGVVEVAGRKIAMVKKRRHLSIEDYRWYEQGGNQRRGNFQKFKRN